MFERNELWKGKSGDEFVKKLHNAIIEKKVITADDEAALATECDCACGDIVAGFILLEVRDKVRAEYRDKTTGEIISEEVIKAKAEEHKREDGTNETAAMKWWDNVIANWILIS